MGYKVELEDKEWKQLVDILNELPTKIGVFPLVVKIVDQVNGQVRYWEEQRAKNTAAQAENNSESV